MRTSGLFATCLLVAAAITTETTATTNAHAQGIALSRFEPAERGSRFFVADSLELRYLVDGVSRPFLVVGAPMSYAYRARTFGSSVEGERSHLSEHAVYVHPGASIVLAPGARFALDLPIAAGQSGDDTNLAGTYYLSPRSPVLGDVRAAFDLRLFGPAARDAEGVTLAGGIRAWLPTGSDQDYAGDDATRFGVQVAAAAREGMILSSLRVAYMYRRDMTFGGTSLGSEFSIAAGLAYADKAWTIGPELFGSTQIDHPIFKTKTTPIEVLLGVHRSIFGSFRVGGGIGTGVVSGFGSAHFRTLLSIEWAPIASAAVITDTQSDRDRDGVIDLEDMCPDVPGPNTGVAETRGCPSAPTDADGDGIFDTDDACPREPGVRTQDPKSHGCPPPAPPAPDPPSSPPPPQEEERDTTPVVDP